MLKYNIRNVRQKLKSYRLKRAGCADASEKHQVLGDLPALCFTWIVTERSEGQSAVVISREAVESGCDVLQNIILNRDVVDDCDVSAIRRPHRQYYRVSFLCACPVVFEHISSDQNAPRAFELEAILHRPLRGRRKRHTRLCPPFRLEKMIVPDLKI